MSEQKRQKIYLEDAKEDSFEIFLSRGYNNANKYFNHKLALLKAYQQKIITLKELNDEF